MANAYTQVDLPPAAAAEVVAAALQIPDSELAVSGRESCPHITLKYGVKEDIPALVAVLKDQKPFTVTLGKLHVFGGHSVAPVVAAAHAPELFELKNLINVAVGNRPDDYIYTPHVTLAYVKSENADKYEDSDILEGVTFQVHVITLVTKEKEKSQVLLGKAVCQ
jgi:2'-5' RNA ligase